MATVRTFLQAHPRDAEARQMLSQLLAASGQLQAALGEGRLAVESDPRNVSHWVSLAILASEGGAVDEALKACEQGLELHPGSWELWELASVQLRRQGRQAELRERMQALARRDPRNPVAPAELGRLHMNAGEHAAAVPLLRQALQLGLSSPGMYSNLADSLLASEGPAAALPVRDEAIARWPERAALHAYRAKDRQLLGRLDDALADAETAARLAPGRAFPHELVASIQIERGELAAAVAAARVALRGSTGTPVELEPPDDAGFAFQIGTALIQARPAEAVEFLRVATERQPALAEAWCNLGHALGAAGRLAEALAAMEKGHTLGEASPKWDYPSGEWVERARFFAAAEARWLLWLADGGQPAEVDEQLGMMKWALARGEAATALRLCEQLLANKAAPAETGIHADASKAAMLLANASADAGTKAERQRRARRELGTHVEAMRSLAAREPSTRGPLASNLRAIHADEAYAAVREPGGLAQLPADEAAAWRQQWAALTQLAAELAR
jgi:tetratricopeptide (TPR) repeat protein